MSSFAKVIIDVNEGPVKINTHSRFIWGNQAEINTTRGILNPADFIVYTNQQDQVTIGSTHTPFEGHIFAPNADVTLNANGNFEGCVYSQNFRVESGAYATLFN